MHRWERRLKDLALLLERCDSTYFDPELFRMNTNQFLQTARTVTFLIHKDKASIADFEKWQQQHIVSPWSKDPRMKWAKDSRNKIEKVGDLELHSTLSTTLVLGYLEEEDIQVDVGCEGLVKANVKRLIRFAEKALPSGVSEGAFVRIERRWVANSLPDWELLTALTYVYARAREVCEKLAAHLGTRLDAEIPAARDFDAFSTDSRAIRFVPLRGRGLGGIVSRKVPHEPDFEPPPELVAFLKTRTGHSRPNSLDDIMEYHIGMAETKFKAHDNHVPMLFMYGDDWLPLDQVTTQFEERSDKYIFWRAMGERVMFIKPRVIVWVAEAWMREMPRSPSQRIDSMAITGEVLHLWSLTIDKEVRGVTWEILRESDEAKPTLGKREIWKVSGPDPLPNFFAPIIRAFEKLSSPEKTKGK